MRKTLQLLALLALMCVPWETWAVTDTLLVADGTTTNQYVPVYGYYVDASTGQHNQMIYPAEMLSTMEGMNLTGLTFYMSQTTTASWGTTMTLSLAEVDDTTVTTLISDATLTQVWQGTATGMDAVWQIEFSNAYQYNGGNLLVDITLTKASYKSASFYGIEKTGASICTYNTSTPAQNFLPKAKFTYTDQAFCNAPSGLAVSDITGEGATLSWTAGGSETQWQITVGDEVVGTANSTSYTLDGLDANTQYTVGVAAVCGADNMSQATTTTFRTSFGGTYVTLTDGTQTNQYVPIYGYYLDASTGQHNQIVYPASMMEELLGNDLTGFVFYMSQIATAEWGTTVTVSLGISADETLSSLSDAAVTQVWQGTVNGTEEQWSITFDEAWRYTGGNLLVDITTTAATYKSASFYGVSATSGSSICSYNTTTSAQSFLPKVTIFYEVNDSPLCLMPGNLQASATTNSIELSWTAGGSETLWEVLLDDEPVAQTTETTYTITDLSALTQYSVGVRSMCGNDYSNTTANTVNTTADGDMCTFTAELSGYLYTNSGYGGTIEVYQNNMLIGSLTYGDTNGVAVYSSFPVELRHKAIRTYGSGTAIVYNGAGEEVFNGSVNASNLSNGDVIATAEVPCPTCFVPTALEVSNLNEQGFTLGWQPGGDETAWQITLASANGDTAVYYAQTNNYTFSQLADNTEYTVLVRSDCGNNDVSGATTLTVTTPVAGFEPATVPYDCGFGPNDDVTFWQFVNGANNIWVVNNDQLYIAKSGDTTLANSYNNSASSVSYAMRQLDIEEGGLYYVQFDYMGQGESNYDYLRAWVAPFSAELTADKLPNGTTGTGGYTSTTPAGWQDLGGKMNQKSEWTHVAQGVELEAGSYNIVFMWCNDNGSGTQPPASVDNLSIYQVNEISINAHSNDEEMGYVEGGSLYTYGETVTLTAVPTTDNYFFTHWSTGDTTATISFTADLTAQATEYIAYFEANVATIETFANNEMGGSVEGGGEYAHGDTATITAMANEGWHFSRWSDGNSDNPRTIVATTNIELNAIFVHSYDMSDGELYIDFDEVYGDEYFDVSDGGSATQWAIGLTNEATHINSALMVSNDGGQTNAYTTGQYASVFAWVNVTLEPGLYDFSYDWKNRGDSYSAYLRAALVPATVATEGSTTSSMPTGWGNYSYTLPTGGIALDSSKALYGSPDTWSTMSGSFELTDSGDYKLVFFWRNSNSTWSDFNPPAVVDNIYLYHNTEPIGLTAYGDQQRGYVETDQGEYYYGDNATLVAVPYDGYIFDHWSTGDTTDTIVFQVNINTMYTEYVAYFVSANPTLTVYYSPNLGNVTGINADNNSVTVAKGESVTIEAIPNEGFYFSNWSDGNTDNPRTIVLEDDMNLECNFVEPLEELYVDFETSDGGVILKNGDRTNHWMVGITSADGGNSGLYITNDGQSNAYTNNSSASVFAYFPMMLNSGIYGYSFDWTCNGENNYDFLRVALVPASIELNAGTSATGWSTTAVPSGAIALDDGNKLNQQTETQTQEGTVEVTEQGLYNLVFYWRNDNSSGTNPPASIDNINFYNTHPYYGINAYVTDYEGNYSQFGYIDGAGEAEYGTTVTLTPMPTDTAYHFLQWSDGDTNLTREVVAMPGIEDEEFVAVFVPNYITLTVYKSENVTLQSAGGYTFESNMQYQVEGGKNLILNASTEMRYRPSITAYDASGEQIYHEVSDSNMLSVQLFTVTDIQISAGTWENKRTIRVFASDPTVATALGSGYYFYGDTVTMMVAPKRGYQFAGWEDAPELDNMREVVVTDNADYTALVEPIICLPDTEYVTDTVFETVVDTLTVTEYVTDTVFETIVDTLTVTEYITDTLTVTEYITDTVFETMVDTLTVTEYITDTVFETMVDTLTVTEYITDTVFETMVDTLTVTEYITDTLTVTEYVTDTVTLTETVFDTVTLTEYINVPVHDTMYVNRYIYDSLYFYDTTYVHDTATVYQWRYDTTYVTVNDSIIETLVDTMYVYVNDTTQIYNFVHDTTYINIHDTTVITNYDTLTVTNTIYNTDTVILNNFIHDTTVVTEIVVDTAYVPVHDTAYVPVHDTTTLVLHDTMYVYRYTHDTLTFFDTTFVHDTTTVYQWRIDTTYVTVNDSIIETLIDTMYVYVNDTTQIYNFVHDTTYIYIHDTTMLTLYDTLTVTNTIVDSVILNNYIHDTTVVTETVFDTVNLTEYITDTVTVTEYIIDTVNVTEYITDTVNVTEYVTDTVNVTEYVTDTVTEYVTDTVNNYIYDTVSVTEYITDTVDNYIYDTTLVTDTLWLTDTVYITLVDTVYIHDTIYVGIDDDATMANVRLYQRDGKIVVEGAEGARVMLYDAVGRQLATKTDEYDVLTFDVPSTGAYLIKVGNAPARRIVVVR